MGVIYLDNAATTWPKPPAVLEAMNNCMNNYGANPGRGSHQLAMKASRVIFECRRNLAQLFRIPNPNDIVFTMNTTMALNLAILGFVKQGQHVICSSIEHNSVRRPLEYLKRTKQIDVTYISSDRLGSIDMVEVEKSFNDRTSLFVCNHSSNLLGTISPLEEIAEVCGRRKVKLLVDAAQTAGTIDINVSGIGIDMLAFPGHKGLYGPQGTGGLYIHPDINLEPLLYGGTGSQSESIEQPAVRPDRYEAGTHNTVGLAGLNEGVKFVLQEGAAKIHAKEWRLVQQLMEKLLEIDHVTVYGPNLGQNKTGIVAFNIDGVDPSETAFVLDQSFQIAVRAGYHCTPLAHESIGTLDTGAVRASVSCFTTDEEIDQCVQAIREISKYYH
ncbi:MAG: aminotransferase class V-fold PLP-dependent enzyme [Paenibacillaceae bacterium]|jgi:cysteine desulfurase family protein|nr:aminotransferase class V-fold PLP-dependent enzyme [Paenibacillaceae bacterium]